MVGTSPSMRSHSWSEVNSIVMELPLAFIGIGNEGHACDLERQTLSAHCGEYGCADGGERRRQIAYRNRRTEARAKAARSDLADGFGRARVRKQRCAFAHRRAAFRPQSGAAARRAFFELRENRVRAGEAARACAAMAAALLDRPFQRAPHPPPPGAARVAVNTQPPP